MLPPILSFFRIAKRFKSVKYDNNVKDAFMITQDDGMVMRFNSSREGLYYCDFKHSIKQNAEEKLTMMITTVEEIKRKFTKRESWRELMQPVGYL
jgi:hypothetical protein